MIAFFVSVFWNASMGLAWRMIEAVEALEKPATSKEAQRYRTAAVVLLLAAFPFTTGAALAFNFAPKQEMLDDILGFIGLGFIGASIVSGLIYARVNSIEETKPVFRVEDDQ